MSSQICWHPCIIKIFVVPPSPPCLVSLTCVTCSKPSVFRIFLTQTGEIRLRRKQGNCHTHSQAQPPLVCHFKENICNKPSSWLNNLNQFSSLSTLLQIIPFHPLFSYWVEPGKVRTNIGGNQLANYLGPKMVSIIVSNQYIFWRC